MTGRSRRLRRPAVLGALALAGAFLVGLGTGYLLFGGERQEEVEEIVTTPPALFADLDLTDEQRAAVDSILGGMRSSTDSLMDETRESLVARASEARRSIESVLTPAQVEALDERFRTLGPVMVRRIRVNDSLQVDTIRMGADGTP